MEIITPGIRLPGDSKGDQKRVMTPKEAFKMEQLLLLWAEVLLKVILKIIFKNL